MRRIPAFGNLSSLGEQVLEALASRGWAQGSPSTAGSSSHTACSCSIQLLVTWRGLLTSGCMFCSVSGNLCWDALIGGWGKACLSQGAQISGEDEVAELASSTRMLTPGTASRVSFSWRADVCLGLGVRGGTSLGPKRLLRVCQYCRVLFNVRTEGQRHRIEKLSSCHMSAECAHPHIHMTTPENTQPMCSPDNPSGLDLWHFSSLGSTPLHKQQWKDLFKHKRLGDIKSSKDQFPQNDKGEVCSGPVARWWLLKNPLPTDGYTKGASKSDAFSFYQLTRSAQICPDRWKASWALLASWREGRGSVAKFF